MSRAILVAWAFFGAALSLAAAADDLSLSPKPGILLLHNGELISGTITAAGDRYDVSLKDGEIHVPRASVAVVCATIQECYEYRRNSVGADRVGDHLALAEWCLRNRLWDQAQAELADARLVDDTHPKIRLLEVRLQLGQQAAKESEPIVAGEKDSSKEQLDRVVRSLPAGSMETFTLSIQPMLLNYCSKGCHGPQSTGPLKLHRIPLSKGGGRYPTQRNLQAALSLIDHEKPEASLLLQAPIRIHGTAKAPIFTDRDQTQYRQLVQWVYQVAGARQGPAPVSLEDRGAPLLQNVSKRGREPAEDREPQNAPAAVETPGKSDFERAFPGLPGQAAEAQEFRTVRSNGQPQLRPVVKPLEADPEFKPKDPFDPELFNRRFFGK